MGKYDNSLSNIEKVLNNLPDMNILDNSILVVVDMNNGFVREGLLSSERVKGIVDNVEDIVKKFDEFGNKIIYLSDCHSEDSLEVERLGVHCIEGTKETEIIEELQKYRGVVIKKKTINGGLSEGFYEEMENYSEFDNVYIVGCMTDICVYSLVTTLRAYYDKYKKDIDIIIPKNCVETYDVEGHNGDLMQNIFLYSMLNYGINVVRRVK